MKAYDWFLFDADQTLFRFDSKRGLELMFKSFGVDFTAKDFDEYQAVNQPLWAAYERGRITAAELKRRRFARWSETLNVAADRLNSEFLAAMAEVCVPMEGARDLLSALRSSARLGVITNGFVELQRRRLERARLDAFFDVVVVSEDVGAAKPDARIFEHALSKMGAPERARVLMVGDNPHSDIKGGRDAGLDTCWLNHDLAPVPEGLAPTYQVSSLIELKRLLLKRS